MTTNECYVFRCTDKLCKSFGKIQAQNWDILYVIFFLRSWLIFVCPKSSWKQAILQIQISGTVSETKYILRYAKKIKRKLFWNLAKIIYIKRNQPNFVHKNCVCIKKSRMLYKYNWLRVVLKSYTQEWNTLLRKVKNIQYRIIISLLGSDSDTTESISNSPLLSLHYVCTLTM